MIGRTARWHVFVATRATVATPTTFTANKGRAKKSEHGAAVGGIDQFGLCRDHCARTLVVDTNDATDAANLASNGHRLVQCDRLLTVYQHGGVEGTNAGTSGAHAPTNNNGERGKHLLCNTVGVFCCE